MRHGGVLELIDKNSGKRSFQFIASDEGAATDLMHDSLLGQQNSYSNIILQGTEIIVISQKQTTPNINMSTQKDKPKTYRIALQHVPYTQKVFISINFCCFCY